MGTLKYKITALNVGKVKRPWVEPPSYNPRVDTDPERFIEVFEDTVARNMWPTEFNIAHFGVSLKKVAAAWWETYVSAEENTNKKWAEIKTAFLLEFGRETLARTSLNLLLDRKQKPGEKINTFYYDMLFLMGKIEPPMTDEEFERRFREGLALKQKQQFILTRNGCDSFKTAVRTVAQAAQAEEKEERDQDSSVVLINKDSEEESSEEQEKMGSQECNYRRRYGAGRMAIRCYSCGMWGHIPRTCRHRRGERTNE